MKTVSGKITSTRPVTLANASRVLSKFITMDNGASPAISVYLRKASQAFDELTQFHKALRTPKSGRKSRATSSFAESVISRLGEIEQEDAESGPVKHKKTKSGEWNNGEVGISEANGALKGTIKQESVAGDGKLAGSEGEKRKHRGKEKKFKGDVDSVVQRIPENEKETKDRDGNSVEEDEDGKKKKRKHTKEKGGDVNSGVTGENGFVAVEDRKDRGKKRKAEVTGAGREEDVSVEHRSEKKRRI